MIKKLVQGFTYYFHVSDEYYSQLTREELYTLMHYGFAEEVRYNKEYNAILTSKGLWARRRFYEGFTEEEVLRVAQTFMPVM